MWKHSTKLKLPKHFKKYFNIEEAGLSGFFYAVYFVINNQFLITKGEKAILLIFGLCSFEAFRKINLRFWPL